jgi:hypothetical protein
MARRSAYSNPWLYISLIGLITIFSKGESNVIHVLI